MHIIKASEEVRKLEIVNTERSTDKEQFIYLKSDQNNEKKLYNSQNR